MNDGETYREVIGSIGRVMSIKDEEGQWKAMTFVTTDSNSFHSRISCTSKYFFF